MQDNVPAVIGALSYALLFGSVWVWVAVIQRRVRRQPAVEFEPRYRVPWTGFDVVVLAGGLLLCEIAAARIVGQMSAEPSGGITPAGLCGAAVARFAWMCLAAVYLAVKSGAYRDDLGFDTARLAYDARLGGLVFLAALVPVFGVQAFFVYVLDMPSEHPLLTLTRERPSLAILSLATVMAVVVAPLFEEFAFRVVLQGWLESQQARLRRNYEGYVGELPGFAPIVITSVLFAVLHAGYGPDPFALFVFSLFLGYAYRQTHRIFPSLVVHGCLNGFTMLNLWVLFFVES